MKSFKFSIPLLVAGLASLAATTDSNAALISLNSLLTNPSFENGLSGGCPVGWTCSNFGVGTPTAIQYPTPNGLTPPLVVPDGNFAAFTPVTGANGSLSQTIIGQTYIAGNTYTLDFWLGNPGGSSGFYFPSRIDVQLLAGAAASPQTNTLCDTGGRNSTLVSGAQSTVDNGTQCAYSIMGPESGAGGPWQPAEGDWRLYSLSFSTNANLFGDIGVLFNIFPTRSAENGTLMHLDIPGPPPVSTPEPGTLALFGLGMLGIGMGQMRRRKA